MYMNFFTIKITIFPQHLLLKRLKYCYNVYIHNCFTCKTQIKQNYVRKYFYQQQLMAIFLFN